MSANAVAACRAAGAPLVVFTRPRPGRESRATGGSKSRPWNKPPRRSEPSRERRSSPKGGCGFAAFLSAPQHRYIVRAIDRPAEINSLPNCRLILGRGPFSFVDELALMKRERIDALVTKNSGGRATYPKIEAARALGIEVVMVRRPPAPEAEALHDLDAVAAWIASHRRAP